MFEEKMFKDFNPTRIISLQIPDCLDFGFCCVNKKTSKSYRLYNYGKNPVEFNFTETFFNITPLEGIINPNSARIIKISCLFRKAKVIIAKTILNITNEEPVTIKISGIGKYPFFNLSAKKLNFNNVLLGEIDIQDLEIRNISEVATFFTIEKLQDGEFNDKSIFIKDNEGYLPAGHSFIVKVKYKPLIPDFISYCRFKITSVGGNTEFLEIFGCSKKMSGRINKKKIIFPQIKLGSSICETIILHNDMEQKITFELLNNCGSFKFSKKKGFINALGYVKIIVKFFPTRPLNYYQRVFCFIRNQDLFYFDLYGSCRNLFMRPEPLMNYLDFEEDNFNLKRSSIRFRKPKRLINTFDKSHMASSFKKYEKENTDQNEDERNQFLNTNYNKSEKKNRTIVSSSEIIRNYELDDEINTFDFLIKELDYKKSIFNFSEEFLDFGTVSLKMGKITREITISNNTNDTKLYFNIFINSKNFSCSTHSIKIEPLEKKSIKFFFHPQTDCKFYFRRVHIIITSQIPKNLESDSQTFIDKKNKLILNEFRIQLLGNSFSNNSQPFIPMVDIAPKKIVLFPPCPINEKVYGTVIIKNLTDTPCLFQILNTKNHFSVYPKHGLIEKNGFVNIIIQFHPQQLKIFKDFLIIKFNLGHKKKILLKGYCLISSLELENKGNLYYSPSYLGVKSESSYKIRNKGRMPTLVKINIPESYKNELEFIPDQFNLEANETKIIKSFFLPLKKMKYSIKCPVITNCNGNEQEYKLSIFGEGKDGNLKLKPKYMDFGMVMVNFVKNGKFILYNNSDTTFNVEIIIEIENNNKKGNNHINYKSFFLIDFKEGIIPAKSKREINITFTPRDICDLKVNILSRVKTNVKSKEKIFSKYITTKGKSLLLVKSNYPLLKIIDVKNNELSLASLWEKFEISFINKEFSKSLSDFEKMHCLNTKYLFDEKRDKDAKFRKFNWDFGYLHGNSKSKKERVVEMILQNIGGTDLEWKFEIDDQARYQLSDSTKNPNNNALIDFNKSIAERKNFSFRPKKGKLSPNKKQKIQISYHPFYSTEDNNSSNERSSESEHNLNAFIQIQNGKSIKLNFKGKTLSSFQGKLVLKSNIINLPSLPINMKIPIVVPVGLLNIGSNNLKYSVNRKIFYKENFLNPRENIISFGNFESTLHSGEKKYLLVFFKPIELKKYRFEAELKVFDFFKQIQSIKLIFYGEGTSDFIKIKRNSFFKLDDDIEAEKQILSTNDNIAYLSEEIIDFRNITYNSKHKRVLFLYNNSNTDSFSFEFFNYKILDKNNVFDINPIKGTLGPKNKILITFSIQLKGKPTFWEGEINCKIVWKKNEETHKHYSKKNSLESLKEKEDMLFIRIKLSPNLKKFLKMKKNEFIEDKKIKLDTEEYSNKELFNSLFEKTFQHIINPTSLEKISKKYQKETLNYALQYDTINLFEFNKINKFFDYKQPLENTQKEETQEKIDDEDLLHIMEELIDNLEDGEFKKNDQNLFRDNTLKLENFEEIPSVFETELENIFNEVFNDEECNDINNLKIEHFEVEKEVFEEFVEDILIDNLQNLLNENLFVESKVEEKVSKIDGIVLNKETNELLKIFKKRINKQKN